MSKTLRHSALDFDFPRKTVAGPSTVIERLFWIANYEKKDWRRVFHRAQNAPESVSFNHGPTCVQRRAKKLAKQWTNRRSRRLEKIEAQEQMQEALEEMEINLL